MEKMDETKHILDILIKVNDAIDKKDYIAIKQLSNKFIHHASIHQDADVISTAVLIYALSKMIERENFRKEKNWNEFYKNFRKKRCFKTSLLSCNDNASKNLF